MVLVKNKDFKPFTLLATKVFKVFKEGLALESPGITVFKVLLEPMGIRVLLEPTVLTVPMEPTVPMGIKVGKGSKGLLGPSLFAPAAT